MVEADGGIQIAEAPGEAPGEEDGAAQLCCGPAVPRDELLGTAEVSRGVPWELDPGTVGNGIEGPGGKLADAAGGAAGALLMEGTELAEVIGETPGGGSGTGMTTARPGRCVTAPVEARGAKAAAASARSVAVDGIPDRCIPIPSLNGLRSLFGEDPAVLRVPTPPLAWVVLPGLVFGSGANMLMAAFGNPRSLAGGSPRSAITALLAPPVPCELSEPAAIPGTGLHSRACIGELWRASGESAVMSVLVPPVWLVTPPRSALTARAPPLSLGNERTAP